MKITFDPAKNARNILERGLPFDLVADLDWETAIAREDRRRDYGLRRIQVFGLIDVRLYVAVVTYRSDASSDQPAQGQLEGGSVV
jgi:uncharacterized protein